jgi:ABC-type transport system involved in multi-copper enzyme maturation permease subunit
MTFFALLTKELRLRLRRERTIWVIISYILLLGVLGWFYINSFSGSYTNNYNSNGLGDTGAKLYYLLSLVQLLLIIYITPAFTSNAVNGEKERQTFDMLLCSRLSAFSLVSGKLVAGVVNALLLLVASVPLFSLVFFFGGISPQQVLIALLVYIVTTLTIGMLGLFCSTLFSRPAVSTAITYIIVVIWVVLPLLLSLLTVSSGDILNVIQLTISGSQSSLSSSKSILLYIWNPTTALISTWPRGGNLPYYTLGKLRFAPWVAYSILSLATTVVLFALSMWTVKPNPLGRLRTLLRRESTQHQSNLPAAHPS